MSSTAVQSISMSNLAASPVNVSQPSGSPSSPAPRPSIQNGPFGSSSNVQSHAPSGNQQQTPSTPPAPAPTPTPTMIISHRKVWAKVLVILTRITMAIFGVLGLAATYIALSVALWTAWKDYRDDCRSQNVSLTLRIHCQRLELTSGRVAQSLSIRGASQSFRNLYQNLRYHLGSTRRRNVP